MSALLELARDYLDRMVNPVYGLSTNEEYSLRFAKLLRTEEFEKGLRREIAEVDDIDTLTSHGWMWLLAWAKATGLRLPNNLLVQLFEEWSNVFAKSEVLNLATMDFEGHIPSTEQRITQYPHPFLAKILDAAVSRPEVVESSEFPIATDRAEDVLISLLQVGRPITLNAASVLLRHHWPGQERLNDFFWTVANSLDEETHVEWIKAVQPPPRGRSFER
jgi:hypothetical protein